MAKKAADENAMRQAVASDPKKKAEFGDPWSEIGKAMDVQKQIYLPLTYLERRGGFRGDLAGIARVLVRAAEEKTKPNGDRLREYRDSALPSLEQDLFSSAPIYKSLETPLLADSLAEMKEKMPGDPVVSRVLNGKTPGRWPNLIENTKLDDVAVRRQLYAGGQAAIQASTDPLIVLMRNIDPEARAVRKQLRRSSGFRGAPRRRRYRADSLCHRGPGSIPTRRYPALKLGAVRGYTENGRGTGPRAPSCRISPPWAGPTSTPRSTATKTLRLPASWMNAKSRVQSPRRSTCADRGHHRRQFRQPCNQ